MKATRTVHEDGPNDTLEDVAKDLWTLEGLNFSLIKFEIRMERVLEVISYFSFSRVTFSNIRIENVAMKAKQNTKLGKDFILDKKSFSLMSVTTNEILF